MHWRKNFKTYLQQNDIIVLYGNIHDKFPDLNGENPPSTLSELVKADAQSVGIADMQVINLLEKNSNPTRVDNPFDKITLKDTSPPTCIFINNAQFLFWRISEWHDTDWRNHNNFLALTQSLKGQHKIVVTFPDEGRIPGMFLTNVPNVKRLFVNFPEDSDRRKYFDDTIKDLFLTDMNDPDLKAFDQFTASSDDLHWDEIETLIRRCRSSGNTPNAVLREYKFGTPQDYWTALLNKTENGLASAFDDFTSPNEGEPILGQDHAVKRSLNVVSKASLNLSAITTPGYNRPRGILFFVGPTGVGKTMLAKKLADLIFGSEDKLLTFDMSEYQQSQSESRLVGAPPGYVGYDQGGQLTAQVRENPFQVLLFDEIDKAHSAILTKFLQILDEGRLTDGKGITTYFSETLIIFTSNSGALKLKDETQRAKMSATELQQHYQTELAATEAFSTRPEILNRVGLSNIVPFAHISDPDIVKTVFDKLIAKTILHFSKQESPRIIKFENKEAIIAYLADHSNWKTMGLRSAKQTFETEVLEAIAEQIVTSESASVISVALKGTEVVVTAE